jgi:transposase
MYLLPNLSPAEILVLKYERFSNRSTIVQKRCHALVLEHEYNENRCIIARNLDLTPDTITSYIALYNESGLAGILGTNYRKNVSDLEAFASEIVADFESSPPMSSNEAKERIEVLTGLRRCPTQIRSFMHRHKLRFQKAMQVPAKADVQKQEKFIEEKLNPLIDSAKEGKIHLLFMDSVHPVMGVFLCKVWSALRVIIKSSPGRKRLNILGAVNAIDKQIHLMTNETYINALTVVDFLWQLRIYHFDMKPIYITLDNARYQHCDLVKYTAWQLGIHLVFLPPYSPNLNLIERLWKWSKKKTLYAKYYDSFDKFKAALVNNLSQANLLFQDELEFLLTLKFQKLEQS